MVCVDGFVWGGVDGGDDGDVVLVLEEVLGGGAEGVVEGVVEGGIEGAEGEFIDYVGEVEGCLVWVSFGGGVVMKRRVVGGVYGRKYESGKTYHDDPNARRFPCSRARGR